MPVDIWILKWTGLALTLRAYMASDSKTPLGPQLDMIKPSDLDATVALWIAFGKACDREEGYTFRQVMRDGPPDKNNRGEWVVVGPSTALDKALIKQVGVEHVGGPGSVEDVGGTASKQ